MKLRHALIAAASLCVAFISPASAAEDVDFTRVRCGDFVSGSKDDAILLLVWIEGYFTKKSDPPIMYGDKARQDAANIRNYCLNNSEDTLFNAAKAVMK